jgi:hypothetical protein
MDVALQYVGRAATPLNVIALEPCVDPKFVPVTVTGVPMLPDVGLRFAIVGNGRTLKVIPLLATPPTVTTTVAFPTVAPAGTATMIVASFQLRGVAVRPPTVTALDPVVGWKP